MVPFVRVTRDKRGYEHIYLMRATGRRGKGGAPRILYVFRTPPGVKVGREPFDETVRRTLEEQNPGVFFDWKKLSVILPPPPDVEYWRERRRLEKAAKLARREEEREEAAAQPAQSSAAAPAIEADVPEEDELIEDSDLDVVGGEPEPAELSAPASEEGAAGASVAQPNAPPLEGQRRRRRRRGGRGRRRHGRQGEVSAQVPPDSPKVAEEPSKER